MNFAQTALVMHGLSNPATYATWDCFKGFPSHHIYTNFPIDSWNECRGQTPTTKGKDEGSKGLVSRGEGEIANLRAELMFARALEEQLKVMEENVRGLSKKWEELEAERKIKVLRRIS